MLGTPAVPDPSLELELGQESLLYGDLVRQDFLDSYSNLTLKSIGGVKWSLEFCPQATTPDVPTVLKRGIIK